MKAEGNWTFWNQYGKRPLETCVRRAKGVKGCIVKAGYWDVQRAFIDGGATVAAEAYVYPSALNWHANMLVEAARRGAQFIVINAEAKWENTDGSEMQQLISLIRRGYGGEIYSSVDTRGDRTHKPYQQVLNAEATAIMPMIYPLAFYPTRPAGYIERAFRDSLETGQDFKNKEVLPTIQTYRNIGAAAVKEEINECLLRAVQGWQAYTVCHATLEEWAAFSQYEPVPEEELEEQVERINAEKVAAGVFAEAEGLALQGKSLPQELADQIAWLIGVGAG